MSSRARSVRSLKSCRRSAQSYPPVRSSEGRSGTKAAAHAIEAWAVFIFVSALLLESEFEFELDATARERSSTETLPPSVVAAR